MDDNEIYTLANAIADKIGAPGGFRLTGNEQDGYVLTVFDVDGSVKKEGTLTEAEGWA